VYKELCCAIAITSVIWAMVSAKSKQLRSGGNVTFCTGGAERPIAALPDAPDGLEVVSNAGTLIARLNAGFIVIS
jgi:hypothetical protein